MHAGFGIRVVREIVKGRNLNSRRKTPSETCGMKAKQQKSPTQITYCAIRYSVYSAEDHIEQFRYVANRRARQLKITEPFPGAECRLNWLDEQANLRKEKNFFETRVTEYQTGAALSWD